MAHCLTCGKELTGRNPKYCHHACQGLAQRKPNPSRTALKTRAKTVLPILTACERCGSTENLQRHHRDRDPFNNTPENLAVLCGPCHMKLHWHELGMTGKPKQTHCKHGHEFTPENTYQGTRQKFCRICTNRRSREYRERLRKETEESK